MTPAISSEQIQELHKKETERFVNAEYGNSIRRLVFDIFENNSNIWNSKHNFAIDTSFDSYSQICCGKGMPSKCCGKKTKYFKPPLKPFYHMQSNSDNTLIFESRFEFGNLRRVIQVYVKYS